MKAELIDFMGSDLTVVNAARVSFDKESDWEWAEHNYQAKLLSEKDQKLISYLAKHNHWTPFSHVQITMRETVPIFVARQRFKHVVGFTYNEVSRRYVDSDPEFYTPEVWRGKPLNAKQGSEGELRDEEGNPIEFFTNGKTGWSDIGLQELSLILYKRMINEGVAPEQARMVLPQSMYTSYYCTGSLAAWARAYKLRIDPHAQKEIQDLAVQWNDIISNIPGLKHSWNALVS